MASIVLELQQLASDNRSNVTELLRKALIVASRLKLSEFRAWIQAELSGYENQQVPEYRKVVGELIHKDQLGKQPIRFHAADIEQLCSTYYIDHSMSEIERLSNSVGELAITFGAGKRTQLAELFQRRDLSPHLLLTQSSLHAIADSVRTMVLEWALKLEEEGITGDGMTFSDDDRKKAAESPAVNHVQYTINGSVGVAGSVTGHNVIVGDYGSIHEQLKAAGVSRDERNALDEILDELKKANKPEEKKSWAQKGMDWLGKNAENIGALGGAIKSWFVPHLPPSDQIPR